MCSQVFVRNMCATAGWGKWGFFSVDRGKFSLRKSSFTEANFREIFENMEGRSQLPAQADFQRFAPRSRHLGLKQAAALANRPDLLVARAGQRALLTLLARSKIDALLSFGNTVGDDQSSLRKAPN